MHCSSWVRSNWKKYWLISRCFEGSLQILETLLTFVFLASFSRDNFNEACKEACTNGIFFTLSDTERGGMCRFTNAHRAFHARLGVYRCTTENSLTWLQGVGYLGVTFERKWINVALGFICSLPCVRAEGLRAYLAKTWCNRIEPQLILLVF